MQELLRFITCGSVDDGKSTLLGRLLHDSNMILDDHAAALQKDSKKFGTTGEAPDLALLLDGLAAEREQGITIDVAYRFFSTPRRKFIMADTPGHEQYTRNMATGASTADLAIVLVDARKGILPQTKRHSFIVFSLGIRHLVLAVNKMDLVGYDEAVFRQIEKEYAAFANALGLSRVDALPVSAIGGDNVVFSSSKTPWYTGTPLLDILEKADNLRPANDAPFRMPVQWVNRPNADFRGFAGNVAAGTVRTGMKVRIVPSGTVTEIARIVSGFKDVAEAKAGDSVTLTFTDEVDASRGDLVSSAEMPCPVASHFEARLIWMSETPMVPNRQYLLQCGAATALCTPGKPKYKVNINTLSRVAAKTFGLNDIGVCNIALDRPIPFEPYAVARALGSFILIDRMTHETVAAGMIAHHLRRSDNVHRQHLTMTPESRAAQKGQKGSVVWMTGLSGAGKSTIANALEKKLHAQGKHTMILDGDNLRHGLNRDLGFTEQGRAENIRRTAEVARLMADAGLIVIVSLISPFAADRATAKDIVGAERFFEIFVDVPLSVAERRDPKGLYKKARRGDIPNFTGINSPYEPPKDPATRLDASIGTPDLLADAIIQLLSAKQILI